MLRQHTVLQRARKSSGENRDGTDASDAAPNTVHATVRSPGRTLDQSERTAMESHFGADFSQVLIHNNAAAASSASDQAMLRQRAILQRALKSSDDELVMSAVSRAGPTVAARRLIPSVSAQIQRCGGVQCPPGTCDHDEERTIHRSALSAATAQIPQTIREVLRTPGEPLAADTRLPMERLFGHDFRNVRIHYDRMAGESAQAIQARAYTFGRHIVMGTGEYQPHTRPGARLLIHELTHVVQQGNPHADSSEPLAMSRRHDASERTADQVAGEASATNRYAPGTAPGGALLGHELTHVVQQAVASRSDAVSHTVQRATDQPELLIGIAAGLYEREHPEDETLFGAWGWTCLSHFNWGIQLDFYRARIAIINATTDPKVKQRLISEFVSSIVPGYWTNTLCGCFPASWMVEIARWWLRDEPDALAHLEHYLEGSGTPYLEDVKRIFAEDPHFKDSVERWIADAGTPSGELRDVYPWYSTGNWSNSFGGIDLIEYEILPTNFSSPDRTALVRVTIEDDYDWHPDEHRRGPCLHTGMEIMKAKGAKSFRQIGTAIVRLKVP